MSMQLEESDITESTMVFTMESSQRERIIESFADIDPAPAESWRSGIVCSSGEYTAQLGIYNQK